MDKLKITGIKRNTSFISEKDGACNEIINLRYWNEQWESIHKGEQISNITVMSSGDILFRHSVLSPDYLILWNHTGELSMVSLSGGSYVGAKGSLGTVLNVTNIEEFGVILVVVTDNDVYYFRYDEKELAYHQLNPLTHGRYTFADTDREQFGKQFTPLNTDDWVNEGTIKVLERKNTLEQAGKFNGHALFRVAFKTKDGGFVNYSPVFYRNIGFTESDTSDESIPNVRYDGTNYYFSWGNWASPTFNLEFKQEQFDTIAAYSGFIESLCIFMAAPQYDWDMNAKKGGMGHVTDGSKEYYFYPHTQSIKDYFVNNAEFYLIKEIPFLDLASKSSSYGGTFTASTGTAVALPSPPSVFDAVTITKDDLNGHFEYVEDTDYTIDYTAQTITALSIRNVSDEVHFINIVGFPVKLGDKNLFGSVYVNLDDGTSVTNSFTFDLPNGTATLNDSSLSKQNFHFQYEAGMQDTHDYTAKFGNPLSGPTDIGDISQIETKLHLDVDNFTAHKYFSDIIYEYNSRLHYGAVKTLLGDIPNITVYDEDDEGHLPTGYTKVQDDNNKTWTFYVLVSIVTDKGEKKVLTSLSKIGVFNDGTDDFSALNPILTYPDQRARTITIYGYDTSYHTVQQVLNLKPHPWLNLAYYVFDAQSESVTYGTSTQTKRILRYEMLKLALGSDTLSISGDNIITETNRLQVSEVNNPLLFPAKNSYRIGRLTNTITAIASQAFPVSTGQFGQYPLYIGSSEGIFALEQGGGVLYASVHPVSSYAVNSFAKVETGIVFSTDYGLFLMYGSQVEQISIPIEGNPDTHINALQAFSDTLTSFPTHLSTLGFKSFLSSAKLGYNPVMRELYISGTDYSYIYNLSNKLWYKTTNRYDSFTNINGEFCGIDVNKVYQVNVDSSDYEDVYIITRPQKFDSFALKSISRAVARFYAENEEGRLNFHIYGSLNGIEWKLIQGKNESDFLHGSKGISAIINESGTTARYFIFMFAAYGMKTVFDSFEIDMKGKDIQKLR